VPGDLFLGIIVAFPDGSLDIVHVFLGQINCECLQVFSLDLSQLDEVVASFAKYGFPGLVFTKDLLF
jgi:hypothetical protein